jgi:RNA polymerase sigma factor (sigma-70 family)
MAESSDRVALFEQLFRAYYAPLCEFVARYTGADDVAHDVVSSVFTRLWAMDSAGDAERLTRPYLYRAVRNGAFEVHRRRMIEGVGTVLDDGPAVIATTPADRTLDENELAAAVRDAIASLPERARLAFVLRRQRGMTTAETAAIMGVSMHAVEMHIWRALRLLRERLGPHLLPIAMIVMSHHR